MRCKKFIDGIWFMDDTKFLDRSGQTSRYIFVIDITEPKKDSTSLYVKKIDSHGNISTMYVTPSWIYNKLKPTITKNIEKDFITNLFKKN